MSTMTATTSDQRFHQASEHLYHALCETLGHNFSVKQPLIRAISEYGEACREGADVHQASEHVYGALRFRIGGTWGANQGVIQAISEYGQACREMGAITARR